MILNNSYLDRGLIGLLFLLILLAASYATYHNLKSDRFYAAEGARKEDLQRRILTVTEHDQVINPGKKVSMVIYEDTDCPFCKNYTEIIKRVLESKRESVSVTYRYHFLPIYPQSPIEGLFLECVSKLNPEAHHEYRMKLFDIPSSVNFNRDTLLESATQYTQRDTLEACLEDPEIKEQVARIDTEGTILGVSTVPRTFIFTDHSPLYSLTGTQPVSVLEHLIDLALTYE